MNMTPEFARRFALVLKQKLEKESYEPFRDKYGPGYLVVSIQFPFYSKDAHAFMKRDGPSLKSKIGAASAQFILCSAY